MAELELLDADGIHAVRGEGVQRSRAEHPQPDYDHLDVPSLRAALWAVRALRRAERDLRRHGLEGARVIPPPTLPASARRGVLAIVRRRPSTCLEKALVYRAGRRLTAPAPTS